ncbi:MAG: hypothetical protein L6461_03105 [Anaerolineae bacterium]|nr:hypothetical protein [Anaerolineae bacterium]
MSQKQILIVIGVLVLVCCCVAGLGLAGMGYVGEGIGRSIENADDPENVARIANSIADYDVPAGYKQTAFEMLSIKYVFIAPGDGIHSFIMLTQFPQNMVGNQEEMQKEMERAMARQSGQRSITMQIVEEKNYTIRGQQVPAAIMEGETEVEGNLVSMRQMVVVFDGKTGVAALMFYGVKEGWDQEMIDSFIASIR